MANIIKPANQAELDAVEDHGVLAEQSGLSMVHLALAFVAQHPAVTAPTLGPRTGEHGRRRRQHLRHRSPHQPLPPPAPYGLTTGPARPLSRVAQCCPRSARPG